MSCAPSIKLNRTAVGSTRPSSNALKTQLVPCCMDGWVKPGHDNGGRFAAETAGFRIICQVSTPAIGLYGEVSPYGARPRQGASHECA